MIHVLLTLYALLPLVCLAESSSSGYLVVSAPSMARLSWVALPENDDYSNAVAKTLVDDGLRHPQGLAMDQKRKRLFVADPGLRKIVAYHVTIKDGQLSSDGKQMVVAKNVESRWVAVDAVGNVFFSDEPSNLILKVPADKVLRGDAKSEIVYSGHEFPQVDEPGGIAVDDHNLFWTNKHFGAEIGSVIRGAEAPTRADPPETIKVLAKNARKSYGICLALDNVYFTDSEKMVYGVKKDGGAAVVVSSQLKRPRGCAWDGDGTVFVADRAQNAVFAFAGSMDKLVPSIFTKALEVEDAFGVAVVQENQNSNAPRTALLSIAALASAGLMHFIL